MQTSRKSYAQLQGEEMARVAGRPSATARDQVDAAAWKLSSERLCRTIPLVRTYPSPTRYDYDRRVLGLSGWVPVDVRTDEGSVIRVTYHYDATAEPVGQVG